MEIILDDSILIQCPMVKFAFIHAKACPECEHFKGFVKATERGDPVPGNEADDFQVYCGKPTTRRMAKIASK